MASGLTRPMGQSMAPSQLTRASSQDVKDVSGRYFTRSKATDIKTKFNTDQNRKLLWTISKTQCDKSDR
jgi:hypothetical protein